MRLQQMTLDKRWNMVTGSASSVYTEKMWSIDGVGQFQVDTCTGSTATISVRISTGRLATQKCQDEKIALHY